MASDVRRGLSALPKWLPPKHFYDEEGGRLFEQICELPEYYVSRAELELLQLHAPALVRAVRPSHLIELGSGSSRKTVTLLDAWEGCADGGTYWPVDINQAALEEAAGSVAERYPWLQVRAQVADLEQPLRSLPQGPEVLAIFLGGTIGNFEHRDAVRFLSSLASALGPGAGVLVGTDMIKPAARLWSAYNDGQGVTARFNLHVLEVINRGLDADFDCGRFEHLAFFDPERQQVEMHLRARDEHSVRIGKLGMEVHFRELETIRTEISRKFTPASARELFEEAGLRVVQRYSSATGDYSLWLARVAPSGEGLEAGANPLA